MLLHCSHCHRLLKARESLAFPFLLLCATCAALLAPLYSPDKRLLTSIHLKNRLDH